MRLLIAKICIYVFCQGLCGAIHTLIFSSGTDLKLYIVETVCTSNMIAKHNEGDTILM